MYRSKILQYFNRAQENINLPVVFYYPTFLEGFIYYHHLLEQFQNQYTGIEITPTKKAPEIPEANNNIFLPYNGSVVFAVPLPLPAIRLIKKSTIKITNNILAIPAAPAASPPKPKMAAMIAITKKMTVHRNITFSFK